MEADFNEITSEASSGTTLRQQPFKVFINHRGPDVKSQLASPIFHILDLLGVKAFFDREELEVGDFIPQAIETAVRSAQIHIAIFSRGYAESPWCLVELWCMLKTGAAIIPVFYDVQPADLKCWATTGLYADAFSRYKTNHRYKPETLENWRRALHDASFHSGYEFKSNEDVGILLKKIVNRVQQEMKNVTVPFEAALYPVGLNDAVKAFEDATNRSALAHQKVQIVGIAGMSGCGKTTLAKELYNRKFKDFKNCSFLSEVRETKLHKLQKILLRDLVHHRNLLFKDASEGKSILAGQLKSSSPRVLIVLDDVGDVDQLNALLPERGRTLGSGSLIIVTTCNLDVLKSWGISSVYKMPKLDLAHATELFCFHAFLKSSPPDGFEGPVQEFVSACDRLPLSLKVVGEMLYGQPKEKWEYNLQQISRLPEGIEKRLRLGYDALEKDDQDIFLDVACFFVGEKINLAIEVWDAAGSRGLENLVNKCLVEVDKKNRIRMHNHLRKLGREIAIECLPHRLWSPEQISKITRRMTSIQEGTMIRGLMAATTQFVACLGHDELPVCCDHYPPPLEEWMDFRYLELLVVNGEDFSSSGFANLSKKLLWLRLFDFQEKDLPSWLSVANLRVLEVYGATGLQLWENNAHHPEQLRELIITANKNTIFNSFPSKISGLKNLTKIALISEYGAEFCFETLPDQLCSLQFLKYLELRHCKLLASLPDCFGKLKRLRHLDLCSCEELWKLPESFKELADLEYLDLSGCRKLIPTPDIFKNMRKLKNLYFSKRPKLEELPLLTTDQHSLRELHVQKTMLRRVPCTISQLSKLETLRIGSPLLRCLPTSLEDLSSLTHLKITGCDKLESLPESSSDSVDGLKLLERLCLEGSGVRFLPRYFMRLANLQTLEIFDCPIVKLDFSSASSSSSLRKLKTMHLKGTHLTSLSISQDCCPSLETLQLQHNYSLTEMTILSTSVKMVKVSECTKLQNIKGIPSLVNLKILDISGCLKLDDDSNAAVRECLESIHSHPEVEFSPNLQ